MATYQIIGNREVAGVAPGGSVTDADLGDANVSALVAAGHLKATKASASTAQTNPEE